MKAFFIISVVIALPMKAPAQMDEYLLRGSAAPTETGLQSGRYKTGPPQPLTEKSIEKKKSTKAPRKPSMEEIFVPAPPPKDQVKGPEEPSEPVEQVHGDDIRLNLMEINFSSGLMYNQASSSSSYRQYNSFSPHISIGGTFWTLEQSAMYGQLTMSEGADVSSDSSVRSRVGVKHEFFDIGIKQRKFFGTSRKANSLEVGLQYSDYKFSVPSDEVRRINIKSSGFGIVLLTRMPTSPSYSWTFGGELFPRVSHSELATGLDLQSGTDVETIRVGFQLGGEIKFSREHQITWDLKTILEKNQFSGKSNQVDPETGAFPSGVSVGNAMTLFSLGYRWGH